MTQPQQRILDAMARLEALGLTALHKTQVAAFAGVFAHQRLFCEQSWDGFARAASSTIRSPAAWPSRKPTARGTPSPPTDRERPAIRPGWRLSPVPRQGFSARSSPSTAAHRQSRAGPRRLDVSPESGSYANNLGRLRTLGVIGLSEAGIRSRAGRSFSGGSSCKAHTHFS